MGCNCKGKKHHNRCCGEGVKKYVDVSAINPEPWEESPMVLGLKECGDVVPLEKPEFELTAEDREKLDGIKVDGIGEGALYDDGQYKETYTREQTDQAIQNAIDTREGDFVEYEDDTINARGEIILNNDKSIRGKTTLGNSYNGFMVNQANQAEFGATILPAVMNSANRPMVRLYNAEVEPERYSTERIAYQSEITALDESVSEIDQRFGNYYNKKEVDGKITAATADAVMYDANNDIRPRNNIRLGNNKKLLGTDLNGVDHNLVEVSQWGIADFGSATLPMNFTANSRPTVQLQGETGAQAHSVAFVDDVNSVRSDLDAEVIRATEAEEGLRTQIENVDSSLRENIDSVKADLQSKINETNQTVSDNHDQLVNLEKTTTETFTTVNEALNSLDSRVSVNETEIETHTAAIEGLRQDIAEKEFFKGGYATTAEIEAIESPTSGDFAYNYETNTQWTYNGTDWEDSGREIPNIAPSAADSMPIMDGTASAGMSNEYARGDHVHPVDVTKADVSALDNYLPKSGNSQTDQMTGDIWVGQNKIRLTPTGNSYIGQNTENTTEIVGNGVGGVDIQSPLGSVKANGKVVVVNGINDNNVQISAPVFQANATGDGTDPAGLSLASGIAQVSGQSFIGLLTQGFNVSVTGGNAVFSTPTGKMFYGVDSNALNEVARISDVEQLRGTVESELGGYLNLSDGGEISGTTTYKGSEIATKSDIPEGITVIDNLTSTDTTSSLSANMGRVLNEGLQSEESSRKEADLQIKSDLDAEISNRQEDIASLSDKINSNTDSISDVNSSIALLNDAVSNVNDEITDVRRSYLPLSGGVMSGIISLPYRIDFDGVGNYLYSKQIGSSIGIIVNGNADGQSDRYNFTADSFYPYLGSAKNLGSPNRTWKNVFTDGITIGGTDKTSEIDALTVAGDGTRFLANDGTYKTVSGGSGVEIVQTTGTSTTAVMSQNAVTSAINSVNNLRHYASDFPASVSSGSSSTSILLKTVTLTLSVDSIRFALSIKSNAGIVPFAGIVKTKVKGVEKEEEQNTNIVSSINLAEIANPSFGDFIEIEMSAGERGITGDNVRIKFSVYASRIYYFVDEYTGR